jgi:hypothetical protein
MARQGRARFEVVTGLFPVVLGLALVGFGIANGSRRNLLIGVALACTGLVGMVTLRLLPPPTGISAEQARARRVAAMMLPNGIIYAALGVLLRTSVLASERGGNTTAITAFAFVIGALSILSGLGALARARRPDDIPANSGARPADPKKRGRA